MKLYRFTREVHLPDIVERSIKRWHKQLHNGLLDNIENGTSMFLAFHF
jgi:hypothetical protein